jgi:uncharacterized membrane protein
MSAPKKPLRPTMTMAAGILVGGLVGAGIGLTIQQEWAVLTGYIAGNVLGAVIGTYSGWKWHRRLHPNADSFLAIYWPALQNFSRHRKTQQDADVADAD